MQDEGVESRRNITIERVKFDNRILIVGCGAVAQGTLPLLFEMIDVPYENVTVVDMLDNSNAIRPFITKGVKFVRRHLTKETLVTSLTEFLSDGDILIDLAWEIATPDFISWCRENGVCYTNASVEVWDPYMNAQDTDPRRFTLYDRHRQLQELVASWKDNTGPTAIPDHGANPGLVSHFVKLGMQHIAEKILNEKFDEDVARSERIKEALTNRRFNHLAMELGIKVIHVSERDTQISSKPKEVGEFVNTWSPEGLYEEGIAPAELGWGTHEKSLPEGAIRHTDGPQNQILLRSKGINTFVRSWVPNPRDDKNGFDILGMVIRHGEAYTISDRLTVRDENGTPIYRPTVHYAYSPSDATIASLHELRMSHYAPITQSRVMFDDITSGEDILGCLLMGHDFGAWWIGSLLDIVEAREILPHQNATTIQVASTVASGVAWMVKNPRKGVLVPDDLPHDQILPNCFKYLGPVISIPVDWNPITGIQTESPMDYTRRPIPSEDDKWQFSSFLFGKY